MKTDELINDVQSKIANRTIKQQQQEIQNLQAKLQQANNRAAYWREQCKRLSKLAETTTNPTAEYTDEY